ARCAGTAVFVNAHHSIGVRALVLFGTKDQQEKWLPSLTSGESLGAFALTEPEAGSDAANVQTMATPSDDGSGYVLNGEKRYITNGSIAQVLTVMARAPVEGSDKTKVTAFLVTPDMQGFEITEAKMPKCGIRGTVTSRLAFHDMFVPKENVLGPVGRGLNVALTVLDYGRTTFGATCTGAAKFCVERSVEHAKKRVQFGLALSEFEMVKDKIAYMGAQAFAMEAATYQTAALMDSGDEDYMVETAILKIFATDALWKIVNDTIQIHGGKAYFSDQPFERMMRDARINMIGEGANDVLRNFTALMGIREVGLELKDTISSWGKMAGFAAGRLGAMIAAPDVPVRNDELQPDAKRLGKSIQHFGGQILHLLRAERAAFEKMEFVNGKLQLHIGRVADASGELYVSACVLARLDHLLSKRNGDAARITQDLQLGRYYLQTADRRIRASLAAMWDNDDAATTALADRLFG
ncbi:MAG: acyl-CoA dehydrogenase family protein, partial [Planctomycetales bacterium]